MIPIRFLFRSRWAALAWAASICWTAVHFASDQKGGTIDAANSADNASAQVSALAAEDKD